MVKSSLIIVLSIVTLVAAPFVMAQQLAFAVVPTVTGTGNSQADANALADSILGAGITRVGDAVLVGVADQQATFSGGATSVGFDSGIGLSSGNITQIPGSNTSCNPGETLGSNVTSNCDHLNKALFTSGDGQLPCDANKNGDTTHDANSLSLVFQFGDGSAGGNLAFNYAFASDEYIDFVNSPFNDCFALLVDGNNIAKIPGSNAEVSINNVNPINNSAFYVNNVNNTNGYPVTGLDFHFDGRTTAPVTGVLTAQAVGLGPGTHTLKFVVGDAVDETLDSAVFIEAGSVHAAPIITLAPATATNPAGATHSVTATVMNGTAPAAGVTVTFNVNSGPNVGTTGTGITNATGQATFTYSDTGGAGTDAIHASFVDGTGVTIQSNEVTTTWQAAAVFSITLSPATATNSVGGSHTVTATVTQGTTPLTGVTVTFNVTSGPNAPKTGTANTNSSGMATFTYSDTGGSGSDQIQASFVGADEHTHESNVVTKTLTPTSVAAMTISKSANANAVSPGTNVTYSYVVKNVGSVDITNPTVTDNKCSPVTFVSDSDNDGPAVLDLSETMTFSCSVILTSTTTNTATVTGQGVEGQPVAQTSLPVTVLVTPPTQSVGGEILGIDATSLFVAGAFANAFWILSVIAAIGAALAALTTGIIRRK